MPFPGVDAREVGLFVLVFFRLGGIFLFSPFWGSQDIPPQVRIGIALILSVLVFPTLAFRGVVLPEGLVAMTLAVAGELAVGVLLGFAAFTVLSGMQMAGQMVGQQMGLSLASVIDPLSEEEVSAIAQFQFSLGLLLFILLRGHEWLLRAIVGSYEAIPALGVSFRSETVGSLSNLVGRMWEVSLEIGAPTLVALFLVTVALGFVARAVPQMNILIVGFPLQIGVGLLVFGVTLPLFADASRNLFQEMYRDLARLLGTMGSV